MEMGLSNVISIRAFLGNFRMEMGLSNVISIRKFLRNFRMEIQKKVQTFSSKKFKLVLGVASSQPASGLIVSEAANAADWEWGCGVRSPPPEKKSNFL